MIDDLEAQASSRATLQPTLPSREVLTILCPMLRLDIRCPAPLSRRGTWGDGAHLRSGIVSLDIHGVIARVNQPQNPSQPTVGPPKNSQVAGALSGTENTGAINLEWQKLILFFCRVPGGPYFRIRLKTDASQKRHLMHSSWLGP